MRLLAVLAGAFPSLDTSVNIAFPDIDEHFGLDVADLQWIVICYLFTYGGLLVGAGRLGDTFGHRRMVAVGGVTSVIALAACAAAPSFSLFLVARVVQGMGTALVLAGAPALLTTTAASDDPGARSRAVGLFQAAAMIGLAIGPVIGGPLVAWGGWAAVYWFRVPIAAALVALARAPSVGVASPARIAEPVDSSHGMTHAASPPGGSSRARANTSPRGMRAALGRPVLRRVMVVTALGNAAMFATWLLVPTLLVDELEVGVVAAGFALAMSPAMSALGSIVAGRMTLHRPTSVARTGLLLLAAGMALIAWSGPAGAAVVVTLGLAVVGFGVGLFSVPTMHAVMSGLSLDQQGLAGGLSLMARTLGVVFGVFVVGAVFDQVEAGLGFDAAFAWAFAGSAVLATGTAALPMQR